MNCSVLESMPENGRSGEDDAPTMSFDRSSVFAFTLFGGLDGGNDLVHGVAVGGAAGEVVRDHDGEDDGASAGRIEIAGECTGFAEGSGLGEEVVLERRVGEASFQSAVLAGDGERGFPVGEPGLGGGELQEFGGGAGGDEVVVREAGAVDKCKIALLNPQVQ